MPTTHSLRTVATPSEDILTKWKESTSSNDWNDDGDFDLGSGRLSLSRRKHQDCDGRSASRRSTQSHSSEDVDARSSVTASSSFVFDSEASDTDGAVHASSVGRVAPDTSSMSIGQRDDLDDDSDNDARSNTIRANQLPADFAQQLAQSKLDASAAKSASLLLAKHVMPDNLGQQLSTRDDDADDWGDDFAAIPVISANKSGLLAGKGSIIEMQQGSAAHSTPAIDDITDKLSSFSEEEGDGLFDDLIMPPSSHVSQIVPQATPITSLKQLLKQRMAARITTTAASYNVLAVPVRMTAGTTLVSGASTPAIPASITDRSNDSFEDDLVITDAAADFSPLRLAKVMAKKRSLSMNTLSSAASKGAIAQPKQRHRIDSSASDKQVAGGAGLRRLIRPSSSKGVAEISEDAGNESRLLHKQFATGPLSSNAPTPRAVLRRKSSALLMNVAKESSQMLSRPASPSYSNPTRSSLARRSSANEDSPSSMTLQAKPSTRLRLISTISSYSRPATPTGSQSSGPSSGISRLMQPTLSSLAKTRAAADPSGRSSAALGRPVLSPSNSAASIANLAVIRSQSIPQGLGSVKPRTSFGDGLELAGFDDLPVNEEQERKLIKAPRRRQSSTASASAGKALVSVIPVAQQQQPRRERVESAPSRLAIAQKRAVPIRAGPSGVSIDNRKPPNTSSAVPTEKRKPKLQLIQGLSSAGLAKVQGEMKWNPTSMTWEGNEADLREFDNVLASSSRPALISPVISPIPQRPGLARSPLSTVLASKGQTPAPSAAATMAAALLAKHPAMPKGATPQLGGVRIVGDMVFDPVNMRWFTTSAEGEDELDFGDDEGGSSLADDSDDVRHIDAWEDGEMTRLRTRKSFAVRSTASGDAESDPDFDMAAFRQRTMDAVQRHANEFKGWQHHTFTSGNEDDLLPPLYDILNFV